MKTVFCAFSRKASALRACTDGSIMLLTGILFSSIVLVAGGATDVSRAYTVKTESQKTLDAAVLSMARSGLSDAEIQARGPLIFEGWMQTRQTKGRVIDATFTARSENIAPGEAATVTATARIETDTMFLGLFGQDILNIDVSASSLKPNALPYEIALVLDVSGSMTLNLNGRPRLERMKDATESLLDLIEAEANVATPPTISVVPYSTSVNLGDLPSGALGGTSVSGAPLPPVGGNVWAAERSQGETGSGFSLSDASPDSARLPFVSNAYAPNVRLAGPTRNPAEYRASIEGLTANGWTAGHLGMIWGVYALSPAWASVWDTDPAPYGQAEKVIIMLTDGEFNTTQAIGQRSTRDTVTSNRYYLSACDLAKQKGITIFTVALNVTAASEALLERCAQGSGGAMFSADSVDSLNDAFEAIAREIGGLRLAS